MRNQEAVASFNEAKNDLEYRFLFIMKEIQDQLAGTNIPPEQKSPGIVLHGVGSVPKGSALRNRIIRALKKEWRDVQIFQEEIEVRDASEPIWCIKLARRKAEKTK